MGFRITAIELGDAMTAVARDHLAEFPEASVITSSFEGWEPPIDARFDLVYAATAWKWADPEVKYSKAAGLLVRGGRLAVWGAEHALPHGFDPFFTDIQQVNDEIGESDGSPWPPPPPEEQTDPLANEFEDSGYFTTVGTRRYLWALRYTADGYIALLDTFSGHIAMEPTKREHLYREIRSRLTARPDGRVTRHRSVTLTIGRLRRPRA